MDDGEVVVKVECRDEYEIFFLLNGIFGLGIEVKKELFILEE